MGPSKGEWLKKQLDIHTFFDLLTHYPFRYIDKTKIYKIANLNFNTQHVQLIGELGPLREQGFGKKKRLSCYFKDETGKVELVWFRSVAFLQKTLVPGATYLLFGKPNIFRDQFNFNHPELTLASKQNQTDLQGFEPVYHTSEKLKSRGFDSRGLYNLQKTLLNQLNIHHIKENIPEHVLKEQGLISRLQAYQKIHLPKNEDDIEQSKNRLKFEELLMIQMKLLLLKSNRKQRFKGFVFEKVGDYFNQYFHNVLPFELTGAQKRVLKEIRQDTLQQKHMNRLIQGDVGSGKTVVALMSMLIALDNDYQACIMAPTEILAQQHFKGMQEELKQIGVTVALLTGSVKGKARKQVLQYLKEGVIHILIGTHALLEDPVVYKNLGIIVIDEQHRFGVAQRARLWRKNTSPPHVLVMTATPIPRTLALTIYGDLDVSLIDELPPGRKPVVTTHRSDSKRLAVFGFIKEEIEKGRQVYIVYPLINESETLDLKDLMDGYESVQRAFPDQHISIVHGRMKPKDKEFEMQRFVKQETQIMVATTVIEVGVNVPNASIMIIENAERFGLSQLHQLRGRVGRGAEQSYCILMTGNKVSADARKRLNTMVQTNDGFKIAEVDLEIRGPGTLEGTQQSGVPNLKIANLVSDQPILITARETALQIIEQDTQLEQAEHQNLKEHLDKMGQGNVGWVHIS